MNNNYNIAVSAINLLSDGLTSNNHTKIREALNMIHDEKFSWDGLEVVKMEWDELLLEIKRRYEEVKAKLK
jgi:hypothetical protein